MKRAMLFVVVLAVALVGAGSASAATPLLSMGRATHAITDYGWLDGPRRVGVVGCHRRSRQRIDCTLLEWDEPIADFPDLGIVITDNIQWDVTATLLKSAPRRGCRWDHCPALPSREFASMRRRPQVFVHLTGKTGELSYPFFDAARLRGRIVRKGNGEQHFLGRSGS